MNVTVLKTFIFEGQLVSDGDDIYVDNESVLASLSERGLVDYVDENAEYEKELRAEFSKMNVPEIDTYAAENEIDLSGAKTKADKLDLIIKFELENQEN